MTDTKEENPKDDLFEDDESQLIISRPEIITKKATIHRITLINSITYDLDDYKELITILENVEKLDRVLLRINSGGGSCRTGYHLAHVIKKCVAPVEITVDYNCSSMAAVLALCGTSLTLEKGATLMFHNYSAGNMGKGAELMHAVKQQGEQLSHLMKYFCSPFLTPAELRRLNNDEDIYVRAWDKDLKKRIKRHF
jgi:ATP-dependent protease ClpP protease subunit